MTRPTYTVDAVRSGRWWGLTAPDVPGVASQVRSLKQAEEYARESLAFVLSVEPDSFDVEVRPALPESLLEDVHRARAAVRHAESAQREAAVLSRSVAQALLEHGNLTGADVAAVLKVSPQRVSQLLQRGSRSQRNGTTATERGEKVKVVVG